MRKVYFVVGRKGRGVVGGRSIQMIEILFNGI
jgi:hypothetical protein